MATVDELKDALRDTLQARGVMDQLKARVRAEVFAALDDQRDVKPALSHENLLINELIREYLQYNLYNFTNSVLVTESGQPEKPLDRTFLAQELNVLEDKHTRSVPLLYRIIADYIDRDPRLIGRAPSATLQGATFLPAGSFAREAARRQAAATSTEGGPSGKAFEIPGGSA